MRPCASHSVAIYLRYRKSPYVTQCIPIVPRTKENYTEALSNKSMPKSVKKLPYLEIFDSHGHDSSSIVENFATELLIQQFDDFFNSFHFTSLTFCG
jgi:hypothetical protein